MGVLKIVSKMMSRKQLMSRSLNLLHALFCGVHPNNYEDYAEVLGLDDASEYDVICSAQYLLTPLQLRARRHPRQRGRASRRMDFVMPWPRHFLDEVTAQVGLFFFN